MKMKSFFLAIALLAVGTANVMAQSGASTSGWLPANILQQFGIAGMPQPAGANGVYWRGDWAEVSEGARAVTRGNPAILIGLNGTNATGTAIKNWFDNNGWELIRTEDRVYRAGDYQYTKGNSIAYFDFSDGTGQIVAGIIPEVGRNSLLYGTWVNSSNGSTMVFSFDGYEWVDMLGGEYSYDGTTLTLDHWDDEPSTVRVTISGNTLTFGTFGGGYAADLNLFLTGTFRKQ